MLLLGNWIGGEPLFHSSPHLQPLDTAFHIMKHDNKHTALMLASSLQFSKALNEGSVSGFVV